MVVMQCNVREVKGMLAYARGQGAVLQLIELETSREGERAKYFREQHVDLAPVELAIATKAAKSETRALQSRIRYFLPQEVEVVRPMHSPRFCANCHRIRLTSDGRLRPCLLDGAGSIDLSVSATSGSKDELVQKFAAAIEGRRPYWT